MKEKTPKPTENKKSEQRLGRGLSALLGEVPVAVPGENVQHSSQKKPDLSRKNNTIAVSSEESIGRVRRLPIEWINPSPYQPRRIFDTVTLKELALSIQQRGLIQPVIVRPQPKNPDRFELIAGERRWRAAQMAKLYEIPALIENYSDQQAGELALIENIQRQDLSVIEEAEGYFALIEKHDYTQEELAQIMGKSRSHIANLLRLRQLPDSVKDKVIRNLLTMGQVRPLIGHADAEKLAEIILLKKLSARQAEALVKAGHKTQSTSGRAEKSADIRALELRAQTELGLSVSVDWDQEKEKGRFSVQLGSLEQFDDLLKRLGIG